MIGLDVSTVVSSIVPVPMWPVEYTYIIDNKPTKVRIITVHQFKLFYSGLDECLLNWAQSEAGKWVLEHSIEKPWHESYYDAVEDYTRVAVRTRLSEQNETFWRLKWR